MEKEKVKKLKSWLIDLKNFINRKEKAIIVVEGKRDRTALEKFGIMNVYDLKGRNFHTFSEFIADKVNPSVVILLADFDPEGEEIAKKLKSVFCKYNLNVNTSFRESLRETGIRFIEEIPSKLLAQQSFNRRN
ncbi:toprim domain-containing protein [Desulfurobacterium atlanticum]|uniref:5S rRNA maturation endonuclease (Ribonuclease M5), contains TOPRIM domain n=1 Tax=Desulfurobacterium atlanticum TaxID=240169 RepID=A0A238YHX2_9BACT|nr:toprim domain-containing protein [Desulfurobacterium atlanticum]SNR70193.1 5S rRNA maturation endonuclease (Ribonuclease M5), contains TOPRIM domain [Desulfurobacterium atlanticum]